MCNFLQPHVVSSLSDQNFLFSIRFPISKHNPWSSLRVKVHVKQPDTTGVYTLCIFYYWLRAEWSRGRSSSPGRVKNFLFSTSSGPFLGSTQPPVQWIPGALSPGVKRQGREADHSPPIKPRLRKRGSIHPLPHTPSWSSAQLLKHRFNFTFFTFLYRRRRTLNWIRIYICLKAWYRAAN
jgi:hypothetical protein